jgi:GNAT superfamily N-acetyltransferase
VGGGRPVAEGKVPAVDFREDGRVVSTAEGVVVRRATVDDLAVVLRHRRGMFEAMGYTNEAALDAMSAASADFLRARLEDGSYLGWLAVEPSGRVVAGGGIALLEFQPHPRDPQTRRAWIMNMYTEPDWRRLGLARRLMEEMIAWCRAEGLQSVSLHASDDGRPLYESLGFVPTNEMRLSLRDGG